MYSKKRRTKKLSWLIEGKIIIMIRAEINEIEVPRKYLKINETKIWFFEMINNIDKSLARLFKKN